MRRLDLSFCTRLTDAALTSLSALPQLASLNLDGVHRLSNPGLYSLANGVGRSLRELSLDGESLTDHWLQQVLSALPFPVSVPLQPFVPLAPPLRVNSARS